MKLAGGEFFPSVDTWDSSPAGLIFVPKGACNARCLHWPDPERPFRAFGCFNAFGVVCGHLEAVLFGVYEKLPAFENSHCWKLLETVLDRSAS